MFFVHILFTRVGIVAIIFLEKKSVDSLQAEKQKIIYKSDRTRTTFKHEGQGGDPALFFLPTLKSHGSPSRHAALRCESSHGEQ